MRKSNTGRHSQRALAFTPFINAIVLGMFLALYVTPALGFFPVGVKSFKKIEARDVDSGAGMNTHFGHAVQYLRTDSDGTKVFAVGSFGKGKFYFVSLHPDGSFTPHTMGRPSRSTWYVGHDMGPGRESNDPNIHEILLGDYANVGNAGAFHVLSVEESLAYNSFMVSNPDTTTTIPDQFGSAMTSVGDLDGDGIEDFAVGAHQQTGCTSTGLGGRAWLVYMDGAGVKNSLEILPVAGLQKCDYFGRAIAPLGDLGNGDGSFYVAVGAPGTENANNGKEGAVYVLKVDPITGSVLSQLKISSGFGGFPVGVLTDTDTYFGSSLSVAPEINCGSLTALFVGAIYQDGKGAVFLLYLKPDGTVDSYLEIKSDSPDPAQRFGHDVSLLGDMDGDGSPDLLVGAPGDAPTGSKNYGAVWIVSLNFTAHEDPHERRDHALLGPVAAPNLLGGASLSDNDPGDGRKWGFDPGRTFGFGGITLSKFSELEWRMDYASLALDGFVLDDGVYSELLGTEHNPCHRPCADTDYTIVECPGSTRIYNQPGNSYQEVATRLTLTLTGASYISFNPPTVNVTDTDGSFSVTVLFEVEDPSQAGNWTPALAFFDAYETPSTDEGKAISGISSGFYFDPVQEMSVDEHHFEITDSVDQCCIDIKSQLSLIPTDNCIEPPSVQDIQGALPSLQDIQGALPTVQQIQGAMDASMSNFDYGRLEGMGERVMNSTRDAFDLEICLWVADMWPTPLGERGIPDPCQPEVRGAIDDIGLPTINSIFDETKTMHEQLNESIAQTRAEMEDKFNEVQTTQQQLNESIAQARAEMEDGFNEVQTAQDQLNESIAEIRTEMEEFQSSVEDKFSVVFDFLNKMNQSIAEIYNVVLKVKEDKPKKPKKPKRRLRNM